MATTPTPTVVETVPLSVWPVAQVSGQHQRAGRYVPASTGHPGKMLPELARRIISEYSVPGQLVADPMCGIGTTLVEAAHLGRNAIGVECESCWAAPTCHNTNSEVLVEGPVVSVAPLHAKVRRDGYRGPKS